ncbi:MAG: threonylcarbamoyl-AMP synthase [Rhodobiaceae bacterium]|nr:threonylcarbamoyl-AMP synthase [Rhodobiaceae bacterium]|tara:strand:- start:2966 stop:3910 length:945 start_codon:yes stop_codon:yes gene_type:complete
MTTIKKINKTNIEKAVDILKNGELVSFPTETVYGLGADASNELAIAKIFESKKRPKFNPLIIHFSSFDEIKENCETNNIIEELNQLFWPGPLTIVLKRKKTSNLSSLASAGLNTLAVRIPDNNIALKLIDNLKKPIAAPSANKSGLLSPTEASHVYNYFRNDKNLSIILDGGPTIIGVESTVVKIDNGKIYILRHGGISLEELEDKTSYKIFDNEKKNDKHIISPGMLSQHYSPSVPLRINVKKANEGELLIGFGPEFSEPNLSKKGDLTEAASKLFSMLSKLEKETERIAIAPIPNKGLGRAINDRINRASND